MSFVSNALGFNNSYTTTSGGGAYAPQYQSTAQKNLTDVLSNQGALANQLLQQSQGAGPNIAQLQLQQATNQNIQQGAGLIGSQRGMNPALAARVIAQQTAAANQNAAGQSGVLRAQQQLAAQQGLANVYGQQAGENLTNLGQLTQAQTAANQSNAGAAAQNAQQGAGLAGGILGGVSSAISSFLAEGGEVESPQKKLQRLLVSPGNKVVPMHLADGGLSLFGNSMIPVVQPAPSTYMPTSGGNYGSATPSSYGAGLSVGQGLASLFSKSKSSPADPLAGATSLGSTSSYDPTLTAFGNAAANNPGQAAGNAGFAGDGVINPDETDQSITQGDTAYKNAAHGGKVPAMVSPGERFIPPKYVEAVRNGKKKASEVAPKFPGKARVSGDDEENDTIPVKLPTGGVVVKRTKANSDEDAREFLQQIAKDKAKKNAPSGYTRILTARRKNA